MSDKPIVYGNQIRDLFGKNLKRLRNQAGLSQLDLAGESNLSHTFVCDIENGKKWLSCRTISRLCKVLHVDPCQFFLPLPKEGKEHKEHSETLSVYINDLSSAVQKSIDEFKKCYLGE